MYTYRAGGFPWLAFFVEKPHAPGTNPNQVARWDFVDMQVSRLNAMILVIL